MYNAHVQHLNVHSQHHHHHHQQQHHQHQHQQQQQQHQQQQYQADHSNPANSPVASAVNTAAASASKNINSNNLLNPGQIQSATGGGSLPDLTSFQFHNNQSHQYQQLVEYNKRIQQQNQPVAYDNSSQLLQVSS